MHIILSQYNLYSRAYIIVDFDHEMQQIGYIKFDTTYLPYIYSVLHIVIILSLTILNLVRMEYSFLGSGE